MTKSKPTRGRPALVAGRKRGSPQIKAVVTEEEHARVARRAKTLRMSISEYIRWRLDLDNRDGFELVFGGE